MLVLYLYTQHVNKLFIQFNNQKILNHRFMKYLIITFSGCMGHRECPKFINKLSLVVYSMLKITSNNSLPMIIGFLETLHNNSTVRCQWSWSQKNILRFKIFASYHQKKEQDH